MRGSLAVLHRGLQPPAGAVEEAQERPELEPGRTHQPEFELHFNVWHSLPGCEDVLDVGFKIWDAQLLDVLYFYVPARLDASFVDDLSDVLEDSRTLTAVFNETYEVGKRNTDHFEVLKREITKKKPELCVLRFDPRRDLKCTYLREQDGTVGTLFEFHRHIFARCSEPGPKYLRFRLHMLAELQSLFVTNEDPEDRAFLSSFYRRDMLEFRLNERRNYGQELRDFIENNKSPEPAVREVNLFIVRDIRSEYVVSHTVFKKMRQLEPGLWDRYVESIGDIRPERTLIYQWKKDSGAMERSPDFIAHDTFRERRRNIWRYVLVVLAIALLSNFAHDFIKYACNHWAQWTAVR